MRIDSTEAYLNQLCWEINEGTIPVARIAKAKVFTTKNLEFCAGQAMQIFGGAGYIRGNPVERIYREVKVMAIGGARRKLCATLLYGKWAYSH